jgi:hypothetical protein
MSRAGLCGLNLGARVVAMPECRSTSHSAGAGSRVNPPRLRLLRPLSRDILSQTLVKPQNHLPPEGFHGFLYHNNTFDQVVYPVSGYTFPYGANDAAQIVGDYNDSAGNYHGFLATPQ